MKKNRNPIIQEKIDFIEENSHIFNNVLDEVLSNNKTVLEMVTSIIVSDKKLDDCEGSQELKEIAEINKYYYNANDKDDSEACALIFQVANFINLTVFDKDVNDLLRDKLRIYSASFKRKRTYSYNFNQFIKIDEEVGKVLAKRMVN